MTMQIGRKLAVLAALPLAGAGLVGGIAHAAPNTPPWEPDPNAAAPYGTLTFYDASGNVVTSGTDLSHIFDYAAASTSNGVGYIKANLIFAAPNHSLADPVNWYSASESASTFYPNATAPGPLATDPNPVVTLGPSDANLGAFLTGAVLDTTPGYANLVEVRVKDSGLAGKSSGFNYWNADVAFNTGSSPITVDGVTVPANGWAQVFPVPVVTPPSSVPEVGLPVVLGLSGVAIAGGVFLAGRPRRRRTA